VRSQSVSAIQGTGSGTLTDYSTRSRPKSSSGHYRRRRSHTSFKPTDRRDKYTRMTAKYLSTWCTRSSAIAVRADRTCMQYFNAIHCDRNISTSEQLLRICVRNPQSVHVCCICRLQSQRSRHRVIVDKRVVAFRLPCTRVA